MDSLRYALPAEESRFFRADPARWLLKARSPLLKWRVGVELLGWPPDTPPAERLWARRYQDADLRALIGVQWPDGLWYDDHRFYRRRRTLYSPAYRGAVWQLPILADMGVTVAEPAVARAAAAFLARRTIDGYFDLGPGAPFVFANAVLIHALGALGVPDSELLAARVWLAGQSRADGGFADVGEVPSADAASVIGTTAAALRALAPASSLAPARDRAKRYLLGNFFTAYAGRFPATARLWRMYSWPQFRYDALSVATALREGGATAEETRPLAEVVRGSQQRRGFWRQHVDQEGMYWLAPVHAGRASRWVTFHAAKFLIWYYGGK